MKKLVLVSLLIFLAAAVFAQNYGSLDEVIDKIANVNMDNINHFGKKVVILIFSEYPALTNYITDRMGATIKRPLISREEHGIVMVEPLTREEATEIAGNLDAFVIYGNFRKLEYSWRFEYRAVAIAEGRARSSMTSSEHVAFGETLTRLTPASERIRSPKEIAEAEEAARAVAEREAVEEAVKQAYDDDSPARFMLNVTYSGMPGSSESDIRDVKEPYDYFITDAHSLSLNMGLNLFKDLMKVGVDFGIKDFNVAGKNVSFTDIINIGGLIGFKWASISLDYRFINGNVIFPSTNEDKAESVANIALNQPYIDYDQFNRTEARTVALMFSTFNWLNLGLIWANQTGATMVQNKYLDPYCETNAFGIRAYIRIDYFSLEHWGVVESKDKEHYFFGLIVDTTIDLGFGWATLSPEVAKAINNDPEMGKPDLGVMYNGVRFMLGGQFGKRFSKNRYWEIIAVGLDIQGGGVTASDVSFGSAVIGAFVRMGFAY
jgi:hypothetical protein